MQFIINENQDLVEIRDSETGKLLGWLPEEELSSPDTKVLQIPIPKDDVSSFVSPPPPAFADSVGTIEMTELHLSTLYWGSKVSVKQYKIKTGHMSKEAFLKLTEGAKS